MSDEKAQLQRASRFHVEETTRLKARIAELEAAAHRKAMSPQLQKPLRSEDEAKRQVHLGRLEGMLKSHRRLALEARNSSGLAEAEAVAGLHDSRAAAIEWALRELGAE